MPYNSNDDFLTYALDKEGNLVNIDTVPNGIKCGCICPCCKKELCAKNDGEIRTHHFAHLGNTKLECHGAIESALHIMAKNILLETKCVQLPDRWDKSKAEQLHFDKLEIEFSDKEMNLRPDCVGYYDENYIWIELKKTHAIDRDKKDRIKSAKIDCIEIDLNDCELDYQKLKDFITNSSEHRKWIYETRKIITHDIANDDSWCLFFNDNDHYNYKQDDYLPTTSKSFVKFTLYGNGKYNISEVSSPDIGKHNSICELTFESRNALFEYFRRKENIYTFEAIRIYSLHKCYGQKIKACYCEIMYSFKKDKSIRNGIRKRNL